MGMKKVLVFIFLGVFFHAGVFAQTTYEIVTKPRGDMYYAAIDGSNITNPAAFNESLGLRNGDNARISAWRGRLGGTAGASTNAFPPLVVFTADDGGEEDVLLLPIFNSTNRPVTVCLIPSTTSYVSSAFSPAEMRSLVETSGWEVAAHSISHLNLATCTVAQIEYEMMESKARLDAHGLYPRIFCYPFGTPTNEMRGPTLELASKYYHAAFGGVWGNNSTLPLHTFDLRRIGVEAATTNNLYAQVDALTSNNTGLVIFMMHSYMWTNTDNIVKVSNLVNYVEAAGIRMTTVSDALDVYGNVYESGEVGGTGTYFVVAANGEARISGGEISNSTVSGYVAESVLTGAVGNVVGTLVWPTENGLTGGTPVSYDKYAAATIWLTPFVAATNAGETNELCLNLGALAGTNMFFSYTNLYKHPSRTSWLGVPAFYMDTNMVMYTSSTSCIPDAPVTIEFSVCPKTASAGMLYSLKQYSTSNGVAVHVDSANRLCVTYDVSGTNTQLRGSTVSTSAWTDVKCVWTPGVSAEFWENGVSITTTDNDFLSALYAGCYINARNHANLHSSDAYYKYFLVY